MLIPADRLTDWTPGTYCGVIGGIPTDRTNLINVTEAPYNADNTGATDTVTALQAAVDAAGDGDVVYLPTGTYRIDSTLNLGTAFSGKTIRGDGPTLTIIDVRANEGINVGSSSGIGPPNVTPLRVTTGLTKGSTSVDVDGDTSNLSVGQIFLFQVESDLTLPVASVYNYDVFTNESPTNQCVRIETKDSDTITFFPPLYDDYGGGALEVRINRMVFQGNSIGVEDLKIDCTNYTGGSGGSFSGIKFANCWGSWIKNCIVRQAWNYNVIMTYSLNCEVRHCFLDGLKGGGSNGAGLLLGVHGTLIEDNIIVDAFPNLEMNGGSAGNVVAFNYGDDDGGWDSNHAPHNQFNLWEGNAIAYHISDGYFGSEAKLTFCRNYIRQIGINLRRFTREVSAVGNIMSGEIGCGLPFFSAGTSFGTASLINADPWRDWQMSGELTTRTNDSSGVITLNSGELFGGDAQVIRLVWGADLDQQRFALVNSVTGNEATIINYSGGTVLPAQGTTIYIGPGSYYSGTAATSSYCELDLDVEATLIDKGNYRIDDESTSATGGDTVPDSLFRDSKPAWFGILGWPAFDYLSPGEASVENIPAGYRFVNGDDPPTEGGVTITVANVTNFNVL